MSSPGDAPSIDLDSLGTGNIGGESANNGSSGNWPAADYETILYTFGAGIIVTFLIGKLQSSGIMGAIFAKIFGGEDASSKAGSSSAPKTSSASTSTSNGNEWPAKRHFPKEEFPADKMWTADELRVHDGVEKPMFIAVLGTVYDVSVSENFIPEKGYGKLWGGRDATFALSKMSLEPSDSNKLPPEWNLDESTHQEKTSLVSWRDHFWEKYPVAGKHAAYVAFDFGPLNGVVNPKKEKQKAAMEAEKKAAAVKAAAEETQATRVTTSADQ